MLNYVVIEMYDIIGLKLFIFLCTGTNSTKKHMKTFFTTLPLIFSCLLSAAHFYRSGALVLTVISIMVPLLLFSKNRLVPKIITVALFLAVCEWIRTLFSFIERYQAAGISWTRLAIILAGVALFTALSALVFKTKTMKKRYSI